MEFLSEYGMFVAKVVTTVIAIMVVISVVSASGGEAGQAAKGTVRVSKLNEHFEELRDSLREVVLDKESLKSLRKEEKNRPKPIKKRQKLFVRNRPMNTQITVQQRGATNGCMLSISREILLLTPLFVCARK